jgi:hypothetical protein
MEFLREPVFQSLLWGAAVLAGAWVLVPALGFAIRPARLREEALADPERPEPRDLDLAYARAARAFAEMGFRPAGRIAASAVRPDIDRSGTRFAAFDAAGDGKGALDRSNVR